MDAAAQDPKLAWMEINTFECPHGLGRLSPESCAGLRNRPDISQATGAPHPSKPGKDYRPKACRSCTRYQEMWDLVARRRAGSEQQTQAESEAMPTYIDCLCCDRQDVPNQARGLCQHCYPLVPANRRDRYSLEDAKRKRQARLTEGEVQDSRNGQDLAPQEENPEPQESNEPEPPKSSEDLDGDPLAGFEFVPCDNSCIYSQEASVDPHGKFLRIGRKAARKAGLQPNTYVHLYRGKSSLALKVLQDPDSRSYKLSQDGGPKRAENCKVTLSAKKLVKSGAVYPGSVSGCVRMSRARSFTWTRSRKEEPKGKKDMTRAQIIQQTYIQQPRRLSTAAWRWKVSLYIKEKQITLDQEARIRSIEAGVWPKAVI